MCNVSLFFLFSDYDYYWYQDDDGNWRNEYDDYGYEFDPDRYEGYEDEADTAASATSAAASKAKSSDDASTGTVIPSSKHDDLDKQMVPPPNDHLSTPSPGNDFFLFVMNSQCGNSIIFLPLRFYVKSNKINS